MSKHESTLNKVLRRFGVQQGGAVQQRSSLENPQTPLSYPAEWLLDIFNGGRTDSGMRISEMTALQVGTVFQCVTIIANGISSHPFNVYERLMEDGRVGKKVAWNHKLQYMLSKRPNPEMSSATFRKTFTCHKLLWGNAFAELERDKWDGSVKAIWPRNPARTRPVRLLSDMVIEGTRYPAGTMAYETYDPLYDAQIMEQDSSNQSYGLRRIVLAEDMIHVPGLSLDGRIGADVVNYARQAIGLALATEKYGAKFFGNGAIPQGLLSSPVDISDVQLETLKRSWAESHGGENAHKTGVLPPGVTYTKTGATPEEGQMLETRQHQKLEIAGVFNVPGHMVGVITDDAGKSTVEQSSIEFKLFCLDPHAVDLEQEFEFKLFPRVGQHANKFFAALDLRKMMYPDAMSRSTLYGSGKQWGYMSTNDIHDLEGMNPVEDGSGDKYWMPINMQDAATASATSDQITENLNNGTLTATPTGMTPVGNHPAVQEEKKQDKADKAHDMAKHQISADASVKIAKATGKDPNGGNQDQNGNQPGKPGQKQPAGKQPQGKGNDKQPAKPAPKKGKREDLTKIFSGMYRDAVGRAVNRKKATVTDYTTIFGPVVSAMIESTFAEPTDAAQFIKDYTTDVFSRATTGGWSEDLDGQAKKEFAVLVELILGAE
jgi:HK97 family phage portal protein